MVYGDPKIDSTRGPPLRARGQAIVNIRLANLFVTLKKREERFPTKAGVYY